METKAKSEVQCSKTADRWVARLGAALVAPSWHLKNICRRWQGGLSSRDLGSLILLSVVAIHLRELFALSWLVWSGSVGAGLNLAAGLLSRAVMPDLAAICVSAVAITLLAGKKRHFGRDIELAAATVVPILWFRLLGVLGSTLIAPILATVALVCGYSWSLALVALAVVLVRRGV